MAEEHSNSIFLTCLLVAHDAYFVLIASLFYMEHIPCRQCFRQFETVFLIFPNHFCGGRFRSGSVHKISHASVKSFERGAIFVLLYFSGQADINLIFALRFKGYYGRNALH